MMASGSASEQPRGGHIMDGNILLMILIILSGALFLFLWLIRMVSLIRNGSADRKQYVTTLIWTVTPAVIIIGLALLGPHIAHNLQYLP